MPHTYDFFVARLTCPVCGKISPADESTNMQTYLPDHPDMASLSVGSFLRLDPDRIRRNDYDGYVTVEAPGPGEPIRILHPWDCPSCGAPFNWAEVVVHDGVITSIAAVALDREHLERSSLLSNEAVYIAQSLTGIPFPQILKEDFVQLLRSNL